MPDFALERAYPEDWQVIGLDEAGRGPWAGPVVAAAAWLDKARLPRELLDKLDDSKALRPAARDGLYRILEESAQAGAVAFGIAKASAAEVDEINVLQASLLAMTRAAENLTRAMDRPADAALVDGLHAPPRLSCPAQTVVKGDSRSLSIAAASILAKVTRDRLMAGLAARHPGYGWERNMGYGTAEHRRALARLGVTPEHRRSFKPVRALLTEAV